MSDIVDTIELENNLELKIIQDSDPESPRNWDNLGTMVCFHRDYDLGDKKHGFYDADEVMEYLKDNDAIYLYLRLYDHSGISMTAYDNQLRLQYPYDDRWDSGTVGVIFVTYEQIRKEYGWKRLTAERKAKIRSYLINEVNIYDDYLTGNVFGFNVKCLTCDEVVDSCWGYYGNDGIKMIKEETKGLVCNNCKETEESLQFAMSFVQ